MKSHQPGLEDDNGAVASPQFRTFYRAATGRSDLRAQFIFCEMKKSVGHRFLQLKRLEPAGGPEGKRNVR